MELYLKVRLACSEGMSQRAAAKHFNISRDSVAKMLSYSAPPGYRRQATVRRPKLDGFIAIIDGWLEGDRSAPRKQRHTAKRVFDRLREEHGFSGGYTIIKDYVREHERRHQEMFVPLAHPPGQAQADFGEALVVIGGVEQKAHFFAFDLPHSDAGHVRAYPAAVAEAWADGHVHAFAFAPYRNRSSTTTTAALWRRSWLTAHASGRRCSAHSCRIPDPGPLRPSGQGQRQGERRGPGRLQPPQLHGSNPAVATWEAFNLWLEDQCRKRQNDRLRGETETIGERLRRDLAAMRPLPASPFAACDQASGRVSSQSLVRYKTNDYSVPVAYGHQDVWIRGYVDEVVISCRGEIIARHPRSFERDDVIFEPLHYLPLIEQKPTCWTVRRLCRAGNFPRNSATLRRLMEARMMKHGRREFVQVLRLMECFTLADPPPPRETLRLGAIG